MDQEPNTSQGDETTLTRSRIVDAAIQLVDEGGLDALSMRKLGAVLGVEAASLYYHVRNKEELLQEMIDITMGMVRLPGPGDEWKQALRQRAVSAREVFARHRWVIGLIESNPTPTPNTLKHHDAIIGCMLDAGFTMPTVAQALAALDAYVFGFAMQESSLPFEDEGDVGDIAELVLSQFPADLYPNLVRMTTEYILQPGYDFAAEFTTGLDLLLDGFQRILDAPLEQPSPKPSE